MTTPARNLGELQQRLSAVARARGRDRPRLLAVSKMRTSDEIRALHAAGQTAFGENYVQEALGKMRVLGDIGIEWHLIGHLQSNKAREVAAHFDWVQSVDRPKLVEALARHRPPALPPLQVLVQVNIDDEAGKHGCPPAAAAGLCVAVAAHTTLRLRGLMAIPAPAPDSAVRRAAFHAMHALFGQLRARHPEMDTLSMGMSEDAALAIEEGSTMVRIGTALFGERPPRPRGVLS